jgi:hypothetical protein
VRNYKVAKKILNIKSVHTNSPTEDVEMIVDLAKKSKLTMGDVNIPEESEDQDGSDFGRSL